MTGAAGSAASPPGAWALGAASGTLLHFFEDGCAVFNPVRWETHIVDLLVGTILEQLQTGPKSESDLVAVATAASDLDQAAAARFVADALFQLSGLELVTQFSGPAHAHR